MNGTRIETHIELSRKGPDKLREGASTLPEAMSKLTLVGSWSDQNVRIVAAFSKVYLSTQVHSNATWFG